MSARPRTRARIPITKDKVGFIVGRTTLSTAQVKVLINQILEQALEATIEESTKWIGEGKQEGKGAGEGFVPKATGKLRDSLIRNLESSSVTQRGLNLTIGTHIDYAPIVNNMPTSSLRHSGGKRWVNYYGEHGYISLSDPKAQHNFLQLLRLYSRGRLKKNVKKFQDLLVKALGQPTKPFGTVLRFK